MEEENRRPTDKSSSTSKKSKINLMRMFFTVSTLILLAIIAWLALLVFENRDDSADNSKTIMSVTQKDNPNDKDDNTKSELSTFNNLDNRIGFDYPKYWGEPTVEKFEGEAGVRYIGTFPKNTRVIFSYNSNDYIAYGRDGTCATADLISVNKDSKIIDLAYENQDEIIQDSPDEKQNEYRIIKKLVFKEADRVINESFEAGEVNGIGACIGYFSNGYVVTDKFTDTPGISFSYSTPFNRANSIPTSLADDYLDNPEDYYNSTVRDGYIDMIKSVKDL